MQASPTHLHNIPPFLSTATTIDWRLTDESSDFDKHLDSKVIDYILANWSLGDPPKYGTYIKNTMMRDLNIGTFEYDKFRTYYIKVKETPARIENKSVRSNLTYFVAPIEFECNVRRLTKGERFPQLNDILWELIRIFLMFQRLDIMGIQQVTFTRITPMEDRANITRHSKAKTVWKRVLEIALHYYKVDARH